MMFKIGLFTLKYLRHYDKVGNKLSKTTNNVAEKYVYNVKNQLKELHYENGTTYFIHDKQGNTIKEETNDGNNIFEYNPLNQQTKAITKDGNTLVNRYDAEGLRYEIEENEKLTRFIFHKDNVLVETDNDFNVISRFARGYEIVAADIVDSELESNLNRYYYTQDEQGSTIFITDKDEGVRNHYHYDAFGNILGSKEEVHNRITYTGQQFDSITQQYYLRARFYNPVIGRFTQEDTYRGDGLNLYAYCANNPVVYWDPSGYERKCPESKENPWNDFQSKNKNEFDNMEDMLSAYYKENPPKSKNVGDKDHGNSHNTSKPAIGYTIRDVDTDEILKYGETTRGTSRYTQDFYYENNAAMVIEVNGTKKEMHKWQHEKILEYKTKYGKRPPLNKSDY